VTTPHLPRYKAAQEGISVMAAPAISSTYSPPRTRKLPGGLLKAAPPDERCQCGRQLWHRIGYRWHATCCGATAQATAPTDDELRALAEGRRQATSDLAIAAAVAPRTRPGFERTRDRRPLEPIRRDWRALLLHRTNPTRYPFPASAREWREDSLMDLAAKHLELSGIDPVPLGRGGVSRRALERTRGAATWLSLTTRSPSGYQAAGDFGALLDGVGATVFLDTFADQPRTHQAWARHIEVADFESTWAIVTPFPLLEVPEHSEYDRLRDPYGPEQPVRLATYGRILGFTREAFLADAVPAFAELVGALAAGAADTEATATYDLLLSNPILSDGQALFSTAHGNLMAAAALNAASLTAATLALARQTTMGGAPLHLVARTLLVGPVLAATAGALVQSITPANTPPDTGLQVVVDPRIPDASWYVATDPHQHATIVTAYRRGGQDPELLSADGFNTDSRDYKGRLAFGAACVSTAGMVFTPAP
jgi:hypothetical protein